MISSNDFLSTGYCWLHTPRPHRYARQQRFAQQCGLAKHYGQALWSHNVPVSIWAPEQSLEPAGYNYQPVDK